MTADTNNSDRRVTKTVEADAVVQRELKDEERDVLRVPISSTRSDREGDRFTEQALEGMADQIREDQPLVFDNHGMVGGGGMFGMGIPYDSRETIGTQFDAEVEEADDGEHELFAYINPDGTHPEGERMLKQVRDEAQAIKFSVGFRILNHDPIEDDAGNEIGRAFTDVDEMETSRVGIPANPDASVSTAAAKSGGGATPFAMHPAFARMMGLDPEQAGADVGRTAAKTATDGGTTPEDTDDVAELRAEVAELRDVVEDLRDTDPDAGKDKCDVDTDCPEGEVCLEGECVPEEDVGDDEEEESALSESEADELRAELDELRKAVDGGPDDPKTSDTTTSETSPTPDGTDDTDPDETSEASDAPRTATDIARGNY